MSIDTSNNSPPPSESASQAAPPIEPSSEVSLGAHPTVRPEVWVDEYGDALFAYALRRVGSRELAEELVQETFLAGLKACGRFRRQSSVSTWLFSILKNKLVDHFRSRGNRKEIACESEVQDAAQSCRADRRSWQADPSQILEDREFWKTFQKCADGLPNKLLEFTFCVK